MRLGSNRTNVGLKLEAKASRLERQKLGSNRTNVGLKPAVVGVAKWGDGRSNRTNVGLKRGMRPCRLGGGKGSNRTNVGLKPAGGGWGGEGATVWAQIGPMWD